MKKNTQAVMFSSENMKWETPPDFIEQLHRNALIDLDVCASRPNVCSTFFSEADNGLSRSWGIKTFTRCFMNPPYGRQIKQWMTKAVSETRPGSLVGVICLIPARVDTQWFQLAAPHARQITHIKGRLTFGSADYWEWLWDQEYVIKKGKRVKNTYYQKYGRKDAAPFPSTLMVLDGDSIFSGSVLHWLSTFGITTNGYTEIIS